MIRIAAALTLIATQVGAQPGCKPYEEVENMLAEKYGESFQSSGIQEDFSALMKQFAHTNSFGSEKALELLTKKLQKM